MLKHWVDAHFYDFELPDGHLMDKLESFLSDVESGGKSMGKWVDNIRKKIYLKVTFKELQRNRRFEKHISKKLTFYISKCK